MLNVAANDIILFCTLMLEMLYDMQDYTLTTLCSSLKLVTPFQLRFIHYMDENDIIFCGTIN